MPQQMAGPEVCTLTEVADRVGESRTVILRSILLEAKLPYRIVGRGYGLIVVTPEVANELTDRYKKNGHSMFQKEVGGRGRPRLDSEESEELVSAHPGRKGRKVK